MIPDELAALAWPRGRQLAAAELPVQLEQLAAFAHGLGAATLAELAHAAVRDPDSPDRLYDLGYALIDAGAPQLAASVLWRCLALVGDSEEVVCELVSALETAMAYRDALAILEAHGELRARSFVVRYLYAFDSAMSGRLELARATLPTLAADSPDTTAMRGTIEAMLARADRVAAACPLDERDLRGWQYVLTGTLLAHQSPYGFDAPMHGRYAWLQDSLERVAFGVARVAELARAASVPCVYAPPGPHHELVARAIASQLGVPLAPWPAIGVPAPGLVAMYDLADLSEGDLPRLVERRAGQVLYAHASPWTRDSPIAPDVTTLLYETLVPPFDAHTAADALAQAALPADELAADEPARWAALVHGVWPLSPGIRSRMWAGGPVSSNRFA